MSTGLAVIVILALIPAVVWGLITWNPQNTWNLYKWEIDTVSKPLFEAISTALTKPLPRQGT